MLKEIFNSANYEFNIYAIPLLITALFVFYFGSFVFVKNRKELKNVTFFILTSNIFIWLFFASLSFFATDFKLAHFINKYIVYSSVVFLSFSAYLFALSWSKTSWKKQTSVIFTFLFIACFFFFLNLNPDYIIQEGRFHFYGYNSAFGKFGTYSILATFSPMILAIYNLWTFCKKEANGKQKNQIKIILISYFIAFTGVVDYFPLLFPDASIYPTGYISILLFVILIFYAINKYKFFDIESLIDKAVVLPIELLIIFIPIFSLVLLSADFVKNLNNFLFTFFVLIYVLIVHFFYTRLSRILSRVSRSKKIKYADIINETSLLASTNLISEEIVKIITNSISNTIQTDKICFISTGTRKLYCLKKNDTPSNHYKSLNTVNDFRIEYELIDWINQNKREVVYEWLDTEPEYKNFNERSKNWIKANKFCIIVPFVYNNLIIGLLALGEKKNKSAYTKNELSFLRNLTKETSGIVFYTLRHEALMQEEIKIKKDYEEEIYNNTVKIEKLKIMVAKQAKKTRKLQEKVNDQLSYH